MWQPSPVVRAAVLDANAVIVADVPCRSCGYNLRGLESAGLCPECGAYIEASLTDDLFRYSDPAWTRKIATGLMLILGSFVAGFVLFVGFWLLSAFPNEGLFFTLLVLLNMVGLVGSWLLTIPNPSGIGLREMTVPRRIFRASLLVSLAGQAVTLYTVAGLPFWTSVLIHGGLNLFFSANSLVSDWCRFLYYEHLAAWVPDEKLKKQASVLRWGYCGAMALQAVNQAILIFYWAKMSTAPPDYTEVIRLVAGIGVVLTGLLMLLLLVRLRRATVGEAGVATEHWVRITAHQPRSETVARPA